MVEIKLKKLEGFILNSLDALGMNEEYTAWMADVFIRATLRGVGHHDINDFPGRLDNLRAKSWNPAPSIKMLNSFQAIETYDGDNGPGEICASYIMERAKKLADKYGVGICTIVRSNHFLAAAPYIEKASEEGYFSIIYTRGNPSMGAPDRPEQTISACPMGFAAPTARGYPVMLDMCLAYASFGLLNAKIQAGESVPSYWGLDADGNPTSDPEAMKKGTRLPIAGHKGFGLAMMGEIFTGVLSGGQVIDEPDPHSGKTGVASQAAIVINPRGVMTEEEFRERMSDMLDRIEARAPGIHIPGQGSYNSKVKFQNTGCIPLSEKLVEKLNKWANDLNIEQIG